MQVIPAVDVLDGQVVRLPRGRFEERIWYADDPVSAAVSWVEQGAELVHVVDLGGARKGVADRGLWAGLGAAGVSFQIGGGIRDRATAQAAVEAGAQRVVLGTATVRSPGILASVVGAIGAERVVAAVDVLDGSAREEAWLGEGRPVAEAVADSLASGVRRLLVTAISRDGSMAGPDFELLEQVRSLAQGVEIIASGGVGALDDLRRLSRSGYDAAIVGRALYEKRFTLAEAIGAAAG